MIFSLMSAVHIAEDASKIISLFLTYNGETHKVEVNHDALATPEAVKEAIKLVVNSLFDTYLAVKK